jgi:DHA1 family quinolone resistance protein-like MFS transporter
MISDLLILTSFGLIEPILAVYFKEDLVGGNLLMAGLAGSIFLIVKSMLQLPFSKYVDGFKYHARVRWLIVGSFLMACVPFIYIFAEHIVVVFIAQVVYGIGSGLAYPTWLGLWSTHLDKKKESFEWSLYSTVSGGGTALSALIGAAMSQYLGFSFTFIFVGVLSMLGCLILFDLDRPNHKSSVLQLMNYHKKRKLVDGNSKVNV